MDKYPKINRITPRLLHELIHSRSSLESVLCDKALYRFGEDTFVIIKPDYSKVERENISKESVRWTVKSGQTVERIDNENGTFETVSEAVEFIDKSII